MMPLGPPIPGEKWPCRSDVAVSRLACFLKKLVLYNATDLLTLVLVLYDNCQFGEELCYTARGNLLHVLFSGGHVPFP